MTLETEYTFSFELMHFTICSILRPILDADMLLCGTCSTTHLRQVVGPINDSVSQMKTS